MANPRMTVNEVLAEMRSGGLSISQKTFYEGIEKGIFPFVNVLGAGDTGRRNLLIMRKDYQDWADEYLGS